MDLEDFAKQRQFVDTSAGRIATYSFGEGPAALFVHGFPLSAFHWRNQIASLAGLRRCIAVDLLGLGYSEPAPGTQITYERQAAMLAEVIEALELGEVDLVGNDSGGSISQVLATERPELVRTLTLTNCEVDDNNPPEALLPLVEAARAGTLGDMLAAALDNLEAGRMGFAAFFDDPASALTEERARYALGPIVATAERRAQACDYLANLSAETTIRSARRLRDFTKPILVVWGDADEYMDVKWAHWLEENIPAVERKVIVAGARLFFPEEPAGEVLTNELRSLWSRAAA